MKIYIISSEENIFASWHVSLYADAYKNHLIYMHKIVLNKKLCHLFQFQISVVFQSSN